MIRREILNLAREAGWDCCFTKVTSETEFGGSVPLEIEQIEKFVDLLEKKIRASEASSSG